MGVDVAVYFACCCGCFLWVLLWVIALRAVVGACSGYCCVYLLWELLWVLAVGANVDACSECCCGR